MYKGFRTRRKRFRDKYTLGKSSSVPYIQNESWEERHRRRKEVALARESEVREWCQEYKCKLTITNNGNHWQFIVPIPGKSIYVDWFPSSGKFSIGKNWQNGFHVHDVDQLFLAILTCMEEDDERKKSR